MYLVVASVVVPLHLGPADSIDHLFHRALLPLGCNDSVFAVFIWGNTAFGSTLSELLAVQDDILLDS